MIVMPSFGIYMLKPLLSIAIVMTACGAFAQGAAAGAAPEDAAAFMKRVDDKAATRTTVKGKLVFGGKTANEQMHCSFSAMKPKLLSFMTDEFEIHVTATDTFLYQPKEKEYIKAP